MITSAENSPPSDQGRFKNYLQSELENRCKKNKNYSLRSYAKSLGIDASTLSKILRGKRAVGVKTIKTLAPQLNLSPAQINQFIEHVIEHKSPDKGPQKQKDYVHLTEDSFQIMSKWYHFAIIELINLKNFKGDVSWISKNLFITESETLDAIDRLKRCQIIQITDDGDWITNTNNFHTTTGYNYTTEASKHSRNKF